MGTKKYLLEFPEQLLAWAKRYKTPYREQVIDTLLTMAYYDNVDASEMQWKNEFIETYYLSFIEPLESDFEGIPDDPYHRDQMKFYVSLLEEIENLRYWEPVRNLIDGLARNWAPYGFERGVSDWFVQRLDSKRYFLVR